MNIKAITRAMELSDDDWELTTKLRALSETERELLITALGPQKPTAKKSSKKAGKKSARASSLQHQIQGTAKSLDGGISKMQCVQEGCGEYADNPVHDSLMGYASYHEFDSGQQVAAAGGD